MPNAYSLPQIYDIAFDFRNVPGEVDFLLEAFRRYSGRTCTSAIELAAGPGSHVRECARRGVRAAGLDNSEDMVAYARKLIEREQLPAAIFLGDMRSFACEQRFDLAFILISSFAHLLTDQDILDHFSCVASLLNPGGIYVITMPHPNDFELPDAPSDELAWTEERNGIAVTTNWGGDDQQYDPITETDAIIVSYDVTAHGQTERFEFPMELRRCSVQKFEALVAQDGHFDIIDRLGDFDLERPFSNAPESVRLVPILRRK